jgi:AcrR family transcriptional regulator
MSPRQDVSQERRAQILEAAIQVFSRKGFDQARMDDLVAEAGLSKGALYWYFKSKDEIILALIERVFQQDLQQLEALTSSRVSAVEGIRRFTDAAIRDIRDRMRRMPVAYEYLALAFRSRPVQRALKGYLGHYIDTLIPLVQRGINTGEFRRVNPPEVALAAGAIIEGTLLLWVYDRERVEPAEHIRAGIELLLRGLAA